MLFMIAAVVWWSKSWLWLYCAGGRGSDGGAGGDVLVSVVVVMFCEDRIGVGVCSVGDFKWYKWLCHHLHR